MLVSFLREIGAEPIYHVPHRIEEGYGSQYRRIKAAQRAAASTWWSRWTAGFPTPSEVAAAHGFGLDIVVVDHHQPPEELPPAVAVVNPHRKDCSFPTKGMCAAGLAFYLVIGLRAKLRQAGWFKNSADPDIRRYLDIVTSWHHRRHGAAQGRQPYFDQARPHGVGIRRGPA